MNQYREYGYHDDRPTWSHHYTLNIILSFLDKNDNKFILDTGCGNGSLAAELIKKGFNAYGTDASEEGIKIARKKYPDRFFVQDLSSNNLPEELSNIKFDTILSTEVIEHLYDPRGYIRFCKNVLNEKGTLIITTPYHGYLKNLVLSLTNKWDPHLGPLWDGGHIKFWSKKTLSQLLSEFGFKVINFRGAGRFPFLWKSMVIKAVLK
jgi:2-polyprenyl-3-methyl-5-hydroxy-6-metoxy-1,4-benzoquinol methylase